VTRTRRLVVDLKTSRVAWSIPPASVEAIRAAAGPGWEIVTVDALTSSDGDGGPGTAAAQAAARGAEVYIGYGLPAGVVAAGRDTLRWAHSGTAGVGSSLPQLRGTGIVLTNSAGVHGEPIADWALAATAYFARGLDRMVVAQRERRWAKDQFTDDSRSLRELRDLRAGVVGLGGLGAPFARRALALGMRVAGIRRRPQRGGPAGIAWVGGPDDLQRLAAESDVLLLAAPQTRQTQGAVGREILERLPPGAIVVNVSRGKLLDEAALLPLLDAGRLRGVALDVFTVEPLPSNHALWGHPRVLISPHAAAVTDRFWERETGLIVDNIRRYLAGAPLANVVDPEAEY
jgi:phosphoglycerate dehydrogenase-like enzyme